MDKKRLSTLIFFWFLLILVSACQIGEKEDESPRFFGYVENEQGPVAGALVRIQATKYETVTNQDGFFDFDPPVATASVIITAWSEGHYVGWVEAAPTTQPLKITLSKYYTNDNQGYDWFSHEGALGSLSCSHCMPSYNEWIMDAHSQSAVNPRFLSMYNGTDLSGNQSPLTRYNFSPDYGSFPMPPDISQPYFGPGYKLDFPNSSGNCSTCHVPAQAAHTGKEYTANPNLASGIEKEGIFCEFCHKIGEITLNPETGLPYENMSGVMSMRLYRPDGDEQLFFGNFDDVTRRVSYLPLIEESAYCASCHFGSFWGTTIYDSFGEWLNSEYSDPEKGQTCQECHMPVVDYNYFVYPEKGGVIRDTGNIYSHRMPGAMDEELLQNAVTMQTDARRGNGEIRVAVKIVNDKTGHNVPTDFPLRQMVLVILANDEYGRTLEQVEGEKIPFYGGEGDPSKGYYAGLPGKIYMKVLKELWTQIYPSGAYWNPTYVISDNRLSPNEEDTSVYSFKDKCGEKITLEISLIFRRATKELMDQKDWSAKDILMESETIVLG